MAIVVRHTTLSTVADENNPGEIGPDEWNENHTVTGAVAAPSSSTDNAVARFDGTSGGAIQNSPQVTISDSGVVEVSLNATALPSPPSGDTVLRVANADGANTRIAIETFGGIPAFTYRRANGTNASKTQVLSGDQIFNIAGQGWHSGGAYTGGRVQLLGLASENWTSSAQGTEARLTSTPIGGTSATNDLRLAASGDLQLNGANTVITSSRHPQLRSYTVATLPSAAPAGHFIYVSDETGGAVPCFSDGTNWRRVTDRAVAA